MSDKRYVFYEGDKIYISEEIQKIRDEYCLLYLELKELLTSKNCCDCVIPDIELNQFLETVIASIDIFGIDTRMEIFEMPNVTFVVEDIIAVLKSEKYANGLIPKDFASKFMKKNISIFQETSLKNYADYERSFRSNIDFLICLLMKDGVFVSSADYDVFIESLGSEKDTLITISKTILNNIKSFDEVTKEKMNGLIEQIVRKDLFTIYDLKNFLFSDNFINGKIKDEQLEMLNELINKDVSSIFGTILGSKNYGKGIIPNEYLRLFLSSVINYDADSFIQVKVLSGLLTSECYEEGFITKENLELVVNKEYRAITGMIYYFVTSESGLSLDDRYNWILGIFGIDNKKELCQEFEARVNGTTSICYAGSKWVEYNLLFPKFEVKPFERKIEK